MANLLWCDGHVNAMRPSTMKLQAPWERDPWMLNWFERESHAGAIWKGAAPSDVVSLYRTRAFAGPAFYYLMDKLEGG